VHISTRQALPALALLALLACAPKPSGLTPADVAANKALSQSFSDRAIAKDWEGVGRLYADSAVLLPPNSPAVQGRAAIQAYFAGFPPMASLTLTDDAVVGEGDLVYTTGRYQLTLAIAGSPVDSGKFLDVRRRQKDGSWLYVADMFNSNIPAPAAP